MKRFLLAICVALFGTGAFAQDYYYSDGPEQGDWAVGFGFNLGFGAADVTNFGIQVPRLQYYFHERVRAEASFNYFFKSKNTTDWNIDFDVHPYVIPMKYGLHVYPVVGLAFWHRHNQLVDSNWGRIGADIGAGFQYDITENIFCNLQYKYFVTNDFGHSAFNLGIAYRF
ncbi:MAG: porin family protein [Bacteroidaceae bacterium]|nr:porin family protein [Bacteroidaceae bacterium]